jgi:hypothetical protein
MAITERFKSAWNSFMGRDPTVQYINKGYSYSINPTRPRLSRTNNKSIVTSVYNQIAVDCSGIDVNHVKLDDDDKFKEIIHDELNDVLNKDANIDQTGRQLMRDTVLSMLDEGCIAIVPYETIGEDPRTSDAFTVTKARVGRIIQWYPQSVRVECYNDLTGRKEELDIDKRICAIIENPFYSIMNEPNSLAQRLMRVLAQLDRTNEDNSAGKMDLIVQLPYTLKGDLRKQQAENRRKDIEAQLTGSQYGIAYVDGTEKVIQLNRSVENNLWEQAKDLQAQLFNQLGFSETIFNGTADEQTMLNYNNRTLEPILLAITEELERKWLSRTARSQKQAIRFFKDPFKLVPVSQIAEIADKFTRNEIMSSNEMRSVIGMKPSDDPKADQLINANLNQSKEVDEKIDVDDEEKNSSPFSK